MVNSYYAGHRARIYLAGPIGGLSWAEATGWRDNVTTMLAPMKALSPMRDMDGESLKGSCFTTDAQAQDPSKDKIPFERLFARDFQDVMTCDAVLFNFIGAKRQSFGTVCELAWAYQRKIPYVVVIDKGNPNANPFGEMMYMRQYDNLADGVNFLRGIYGWPQYELAGSHG